MHAVTGSADIYRAIADPTRRSLLDLLRDGERPVKDLRPPFKMSQPALSQHLRVLHEVGLVSRRRRGREHWYRLNPDPLTEIASWLAAYEHFWRGRLAALREHLERTP